MATMADLLDDYQTPRDDPTRNYPMPVPAPEPPRVTEAPPPLTQTGDKDWTTPGYEGGANASRRAPRVGRNAQGGWSLFEHDHERPLQPNEVADAAAYANAFRTANPTGFIQPGAPGYVAGQAQSNADYGAALNPPGTGSFNDRLGQNPGARWGALSVPNQGFNFGRDQDVTRSAKDAFAYAANLGAQAGGGDQWRTKEGAQQFAQLYVQPYLQSLGYKVLGVNGDQINIVTREDEAAGNTAGSWFDFVVNAGGENPELAWQIQSGTGATADPTQGGQSYRRIFESLTGGRAPSLASLQAMEPELRRYGMSLEYNANRTGADIRLPTGEVVDVVQNMAGQGTPAWQWLGGDAVYNPMSALTPGGTSGGGATGTTTGGATGTTTTTPTTPTDYRAAFDSAVQGLKQNATTLQSPQVVDALAKAGITVQPQPDGSVRLKLPNGQIINPIKDYGSGVTGWQWATV